MLCLPVECRRRLKRNPRAELQLAHALSARDYSKSRRADSGSGSVQAGHVEHIERLPAKLQVDALSKLESPEDGKVNVAIRWLIQKIARGVAVDRRRPRRQIPAEGRRIEPALRSANRRT